MLSCVRSRTDSGKILTDTRVSAQRRPKKLKIAITMTTAPTSQMMLFMISLLLPGEARDSGGERGPTSLCRLICSRHQIVIRLREINHQARLMFRRASHDHRRRHHHHDSTVVTGFVLTHRHHPVVIERRVPTQGSGPILDGSRVLMGVGPREAFGTHPNHARNQT